MAPKAPRASARQPVKTWIVVVWAVPSVVFLAFAALRLLGVTGNRYIIATVALTPYIGVVGLALGVVGLFMRRWIFGGIVLAFAMIASAAVVPRLVTDDQPTVFGPQLTVMTANLYVGRADAVALLDLVKQHNVDVLSLQELSPAMVQDLDLSLIHRPSAGLPARGWRRSSRCSRRRSPARPRSRSQARSSTCPAWSTPR